MYHVIRKDLYDHFDAEGQLTSDHLFLTRRKYKDGKVAEHLVTGDVVGHKINDPEFDSIEYYGINERTAYEPSTLEQSSEAPKPARKGKKAVELEETA